MERWESTHMFDWDNIYGRGDTGFGGISAIYLLGT